MANKSLFSSARHSRTTTFNRAGGTAYALPAKHALAQYVATGCLNGTFYASAEEQLDAVMRLCGQVEPEFIARLALYARSRAHMKDLPALLVAHLSVRSPGLMAEVFDRVIDSPKVLRNFVQIMRSGVVGRQSLGTLPKRLVRQWLDARTDDQLFRASVGADPSLADIVKMVHPKPLTPSRAALYAYLIEKPYDRAALPALVRAFEAFKSGSNNKGVQPPEVPMEMLTGLDLKLRHWKAIAAKAPMQTARMNLNTFARHGVFSDLGVTTAVARTLRAPGRITGARIYPYQLMIAYTMAGPDVPAEVKEALQDALETAVRNVPRIDGKVWVFPDVSGSMSSPVTGRRQGATTAVRCIDVAALVAASIVRHNPRSSIVPFENNVVPFTFNPRDSIMTNAQKLASIGGGGTNCSAPLALLNNRRETGSLVIYISDNESWIDSSRPGASSMVMDEWEIFKKRSPNARLVCLDIQPNSTTQAPERDDILNIGGFSDAVFDVISTFASGRLGADHWVGVIEQTAL